jgi:Carboxypeptidase regulatory-like domain/TonB dependent receptor/TonB-dependent Receptor Plug Domain
MRFPRIILLDVCFVLIVLRAVGQSPNGNINGLVLDPTNRVISAAEIIAVNDLTGIQYTTKTNNEGIYVLPNLPPGPYRIQVSKMGFKTIIKPDIVLNIQDALSINFTLPVGALLETVTVQGGTPPINTESATVSTVVDQKYVENMPLNGRSFQDLILLTPGVVTNTPQNGAGVGSTGEFSVNGQRTETNYYTVDGVSANVGILAGSLSAPSNSGSVAASTALGTTQALVSVDALQEFRIQSSTYSAEYGRNPGGQFSMVTRSGTNQWHGSAFDYLRNDIFDANDWFSDYLSQPKHALRQNDFGGTLGGPISIPRVYSGKDRAFFFFSYEGLRLLQPQAATISHVPDNALRTSAPVALRPILNAFPVQNGPELGDGMAEFIGNWSNPGQLDAYSIRFDYALNDKLKVFFRFGDSSSRTASRFGGIFSVPSDLSSNAYTIQTYTFGTTSLLSPKVSNEFHLNFSSNENREFLQPDNFGGAQAPNLFQLQGLPPDSLANIEVNLYFDDFFPTLAQQVNLGRQQQWNIIDAASLFLGRHQIKFGADLRRLAPVQYQSNPLVIYEYDTSSSVLANSVNSGFAQSSAVARPIYINSSVFAQDEWHVASRLTLSLGLRWEVNPAPSAVKGNLPYTLQGGTNLGTATLAPQGTPLWKTTWYNFAPRLGLAYVLRDKRSFETVVRGGGGVFFDTGQQVGSVGYLGPGFNAQSFFGEAVGSSASFPLPASQVTPQITNPPAPPWSPVVAYSPHQQLPFTLQWNASIQQALGRSQALTISYVGANGRRLLEAREIEASQFNPNFGEVVQVSNGSTSDYNAFQLQFQRRLLRGLQALASYTWAHSIDYGSLNFSQPYLRGNSDYDVRHSFSEAVSYDLPDTYHSRLVRTLLHHWGVDSRFSARTGFPVLVTGGRTVDPATGQLVDTSLNIVPGQPLYVSQCQNPSGVSVFLVACPGGRAINPNAFSLPASGTVGDAPRNFVRGFGAWQMNLAARREIPIHGRLKLQFRAEAFNIFNHPNFGMINPLYCSSSTSGCTFGQAVATLAQSSGVLNSLYQTGGPRSLQFALKLLF